MAEIRLSRSCMYPGLPTNRWVVYLRSTWLQTDRSSVALDTIPMLNLNATHELCVVGDLWPDRILLTCLCDVAIHCCSCCELYSSRAWRLSDTFENEMWPSRHLIQFLYFIWNAEKEGMQSTKHSFICEPLYSDVKTARSFKTFGFANWKTELKK
jgi:hypothetical protein